jgi:hypothetical protein
VQTTAAIIFTLSLIILALTTAGVGMITRWYRAMPHSIRSTLCAIATYILGSSLLAATLTGVALIAYSWWAQQLIAWQAFGTYTAIGGLIGAHIGLACKYLAAHQDDSPAWEYASHSPFRLFVVIVLLGCTLYWALFFM